MAKIGAVPTSPPVDPAGAAAVDAAQRELPGLADMLAELEGAPGLHRPSAQWDELLARNLRQLAECGFDSFKETVNTNYFQFEPGSPFSRGVRAPISRRLLRLWLARPVPGVLRARLAEPGRSLHEGADARWHGWLVAALCEFARRRDPHGALARLEEPELGRPPAVLHRGRRISEDLANSTLELATITEALGPERTPGRTVIELGAGYGRFAWLVLSLFAGVRYVVCDIPPALAISQRYLTTLFPQARAFRFRHFHDPAEVASELRDAQLAFLMPHQLERLPPLKADLLVNVSSLHEMRKDQIDAYFGQIARHASGGAFYTKQWERFTNSFDGLVVEKSGYPVPASWRTLLDRPAPASPGFFEAVYEVR